MAVNSLWVVEIWREFHKTIPPRWEPTAVCGLTREEARQGQREWRENYEHDKLRVRRYVCAEAARIGIEVDNDFEKD